MRNIHILYSYFSLLKGGALTTCMMSYMRLEKRLLSIYLIV